MRTHFQYDILTLEFMWQGYVLPQAQIYSGPQANDKFQNSGSTIGPKYYSKCSH